MKNVYLTLFAFIFCFSGCFTWGSRAAKYLPETTALEQDYSYDGEVIIVGAGAAGLAAARVLDENNIAYIILEATNRFGGRLGEDTEFADFPIDLGAEWIHNNAEILDVLSGVPGTATIRSLSPITYKTPLVGMVSHMKQFLNGNLDAMFSYFPEYKFKTSTWYDFVRTHFGSHVEGK